MSNDLDHLRDWIGREERAVDRASASVARGLYATLDRVDLLSRDEVPMPLTAHWMHFHPAVAQSEIGPDGHPKRGGFLPPVPLPRRMWAGSRIAFARRMIAGETIERNSSIKDVQVKHGRSGALVFVTVQHRVDGEHGPILTDQHDIVYREAPVAGAAQPAARRPDALPQWQREVRPDAVLLFRYSALTFNGHRIHYDHPYVTQVEGYPGLVVHGPLIATLLLDLLERQLPGVDVRSFEFRAVSPLTDVAPFLVCGVWQDATAKLWAQSNEGALAMEATATVEQR